jgi:hypothetical protein
MPGNEQQDAATGKPFRFKGSPEQEERSGEDSTEHKRKRRHHHRRHHSSRHRTKRPKVASHVEDDPWQMPDHMRSVDSDQAFRESLFDALGDDEGANFWEGVYGQPIHKYPNQYIDADTGELETMNDDEYAQYVRRKMWEKSREGIEAAREEKRRERAQERAEAKRAQAKEPSDTSKSGAYNNFVFDFEIEASLRRGQRRKDDKRWKDLWRNYLLRWDALQSLVGTVDQDDTSEKIFLRNKIAWPVESGKRKDVNPEEIESFMTAATQAGEPDEDSRTAALAAAVKAERIRWHPDKIQQRYGALEIEEVTMKGVTATFQVLDRMWNELRHKQP